MIGDYILHFPLTDFAVSLLVIAALIDVGGRLLGRATWTVAVDVLLATGFTGALAAVGSGLWLLAGSDHPHDLTLSRHHWFAYGALAAASAAVVARLLQRRWPSFAAARTAMLVIAAGLVSGAGFYGGKMAHPAAGGDHGHDADSVDMHSESPTTMPASAPTGDAGTLSDAALPDGDPAAPAVDALVDAMPKPAGGHDGTPHRH